MEAVKNVLSKLGLGEEEGAPAREPTTEEVNELRERYTKAKQEHVLSFYDSLSVPEKAVSTLLWFLFFFFEFAQLTISRNFMSS